MAFKLVTGFFLVTVLAMLSTLTVIGTMMRARMFRAADVDLAQRALVLRTVLQDREMRLAQEAISSANLDGLSVALAQKDYAQLKRVLIPALFSDNADSLYIVLPNRSVMLYLGDPMGDGSAIGKLSLVDSSFDLVPVSSPVELQGTLWLAAVAPHRSLDGEIDAVILIGKQLDSDYLHTLSKMLGTQVALLTTKSIEKSNFFPGRGGSRVTAINDGLPQSLHRLNAIDRIVSWRIHKWRDPVRLHFFRWEGFQQCHQLFDVLISGV